MFLKKKNCNITNKKIVNVYCKTALYSHINISEFY